MRNHIQGVALLILLMAALWGTVRLAGPVLSGAFGDEGAVQARVAEDRVDLSTDDAEPEEPLSPEEVFTIQWRLAAEGFLDVETDLDGIMGPRTRAAMQEAKTAFGLGAVSDRALLEHLEPAGSDPFTE